MADPYNLQRFVDAQAGVYTDAVRELRLGRKQTHWMWFVFPQLSGLGRSGPADRYGISSVDEARAYLAHPVLGPRLRECARLLSELPGPRPVQVILGPIDALKLRSSMTLFLQASPGDPDFQAVLDRYYGGRPDQLTLGML